MRKKFQRYTATCCICLSLLLSTAVKAVDDQLLFEQGVALSNQGQWAKAADVFKQVAQRNPSWPEPKNNLAVAMLQLGHVEQAQQALEDAVTSQPSFRTAQLNRKRLYEHLAAAAYDKAIGVADQTRLPRLDLLTDLALEPEVVEPPAPIETVTMSVEEPSGATVDQIKQHLFRWSRAWSVADVDQYLSAYSRRFQPEDARKDYNQWRNIRRARLKLSKNTEVTLDAIKIYLDHEKHQALAEFVQHYRSATYSDKVIKQLHMAYENKQWLIMSERVIKQLN